MFSMVYKSEAAENLDVAGIQGLFKNAQIKNKKIGITGCLLHHQGRFVQLLEGEEAEVKALFTEIKRDTRHQNITVLQMEESVLRIFGDWSMIYSNVEEGSSRDEIKKRQLFDEIFHTSNAVFSPSNSKLALWVQVNKLLDNDISRVA